MTSIWVIMLKRRDGVIYADMHKVRYDTFFLSKEDAEKELDRQQDLVDPNTYKHWHVVEIYAGLPGEVQWAHEVTKDSNLHPDGCFTEKGQSTYSSDCQGDGHYTCVDCGRFEPTNEEE